MIADDALGERLLLLERDALIPLLRARLDRNAADFDRPTVLPGWTVRDVLAHCSAALGMAAAGKMHGFTPEENEVDVRLRRDWAVGTLLDELAEGYTGGAAAIGAAGGAMDGLALGEWIHGGDVRDALGEPDAYAGVGTDVALALTGTRSRRAAIPTTHVVLTDRMPDGELDLGPVGTDETHAHLTTDTATLFRVIAGRAPDASRFTLTGAAPSQLLLFPVTGPHVAAIDEIPPRTLYALLRLRVDVFVAEQSCAYAELDGRDLEPAARHFWLTGDDSERPVAYLRVLREGDVSRIGRVCVAADARGAGHASTLLAAALDEIGAREVTLHAQTYATALYARVGFVVNGPEFLEDGIPHVAMVRHR